MCRQKSFKLVYKALFFSISLVFWITSEASSQLLIGPKIGGGISWMNFEDDDFKERFSADPIPTYNAGFMVAMKVQKRFFLQAEFIYSRRGKITKPQGGLGSITMPLPDQSIRSKLVNHYFGLPVTYRIDFKSSISNLKFRWYAGLGPNISYWLKSNGEYSSGEEGVGVIEFETEFASEPELPESDKLYVERPNRVQLGFNVSTGLVLEHLPNQTIVVNVRFDVGHSFLGRSRVARFANVNEYAESLRVRSNAIVVSVGYLFDTKISERKKGKSTNKGRDK